MHLFLHSFSAGVANLTQPQFILAVVAGTLWGVVGGVHPGGSAGLSVGVALPFTFVMDPVQSVAFLLAILVGVNFANSIPAVLIGVPGTPSAVLTAQDGYILHQRGETAQALGVVYISSIVGQVISIFCFVAFVVPLANLAYLFLPPELFAMSLLGMTAVVGLAGKSIVKGAIAGAIGLLVALVGVDPISNLPRFTFGQQHLDEGFNVVAVVIGLLAISEIVRQCRQVHPWPTQVRSSSPKFPGRAVLRRIIRPLLIGTSVGVVMGIAPGAGAEAAAFFAYQQSKATSKHPEEYGKGSIEGIAANESAQQACQAGDLIPTLAVGIPGGATMILILAALTLHGLVPGPLLIKQSPELLDGAVGGLLGSALFLAIIGWPLAKVAARLATLDRSAVLVTTLLLSIVGVYSVNQSMFDVWVALGFGLVGYFMIRYGYSVAAAALGAILGGNLEATLRQGLLLEDDSIGKFVGRPVTAAVLALCLLALVWGVRTEWRARRSIRTENDTQLPAPLAENHPTRSAL